jgi:hypothetical protein
MVNHKVVNKYFEDLNQTYADLDLHKHPQRIWNIDETNVPLTHKQSKVLAECGQRNVLVWLAIPETGFLC